MAKHSKLDWFEIEKQYAGQWVLLDDFDWPMGQPYPNSGKILCHSTNKKEFDRMAIEDQAPEVARVYVGKPQIPNNTIINCNMFKMSVCN